MLGPYIKSWGTKASANADVITFVQGKTIGTSSSYMGQNV